MASRRRRAGRLHRQGARRRTPSEVAVRESGRRPAARAARPTPDDRGRVIGRQGRVAKAMRALLGASRDGARLPARHRRLKRPRRPRGFPSGAWSARTACAGELRVQCSTDTAPTAIAALAQLWLAPRDADRSATRRAHRIESARRGARGECASRSRASSDREAAEALRGRSLSARDRGAAAGRRRASTTGYELRRLPGRDRRGPRARRVRGIWEHRRRRRARDRGRRAAPST